MLTDMKYTFVAEGDSENNIIRGDNLEVPNAILP